MRGISASFTNRIKWVNETKCSVWVRHPPSTGHRLLLLWAISHIHSQRHLSITSSEQLTQLSKWLCIVFYSNSVVWQCNKSNTQPNTVEVFSCLAMGTASRTLQQDNFMLKKSSSIHVKNFCISRLWVIRWSYRKSKLFLMKISA